MVRSNPTFLWNYTGRSLDTRDLYYGLSTQLLRTVFPLLKLDTSEIPLIHLFSLRAP